MQPAIGPLVCLDCRSPLQSQEAVLACPDCGRSYPLEGGVPVMREGTSAFQDYYDSDYTDESFHEEDTEIKLRKIFRILPTNLEVRSLMDLGCGTGKIGTAVAARLGCARIVFADLSTAAMPLIEGEGMKVVTDAEQIPLPDGCLDMTIMADVLEHVPDPERALAEQRRLTRYLLLKLPLDGALLRRLYIALLQVRHGEDYWKKVYGHVNRYTRRTLLASLAEHGFEPLVVDVSDEPSNSATPFEKVLHGIQTLGSRVLPASWFEILFGGDITIVAENRNRRP